MYPFLSTTTPETKLRSALNHLGRRNIHNRRLHFAHNRSKGARQLHRVRNRQRRGVRGGRRMRCSHASGSHGTDHNADGQCDCNQKGREKVAISPGPARLGCIKMAPRTMYRKIWDAHVVHEAAGEPSLIYIDRHLVHEGTSPQAFSGLKEAGRKVGRPDLAFAVMDHSVPTKNRHLPILDADAAGQFSALERNCRESGITLFDMFSHNQGIVHVIGPELGITQPGQTIVCGDSHTSTHGAFGTLAFGIGTSEVEHVLATQCLSQSRSKTLHIVVNGKRPAGVTAKDIILAIIGKIGISGGTGHVAEYGGEAIRGLSMDGRMTVCNMTIEGGARAGMVAPDETTFAYLEGRPFVPRGKAFQEAVDRWKQLHTDDGAKFDMSVSLNAQDIAPQVTWGTNPGMVA